MCAHVSVFTDTTGNRHTVCFFFSNNWNLVLREVSWLKNANE